MTVETEGPDPARLLDAIADVVMAIDANVRVVYMNAAAELRGWRREDWIGCSALDMIHPDDLGLAMSSMETMAGKPVGSPIEVRVIHPTEGWHLFELLGSNHLLDDQLGVIVLSCRDLSERRRWEVAGGEVARFQAIVHHSSAVTMLVDVDGRIQSISAAITRLVGHDPERLAGTRFSSLAAPGHEPVLEEALRHRAGRMLTTVEVPVRSADAGAPRPFRFEVVDLCDDSIVAGYVVTGYDVTELHSARDALHELATHDALTGLPNRIALNQRIGDALVRGSAHDRVGLLFVDLDRFKPVNDLFGHDAGDELLVAVAARLTSMVRSTDMVARIGGDEFVVLTTGIASRQSIEELARRVELELSEAFTLRAGVATISASVGVALAETSSTVSSLLAEADQAMYHVKSGRRDGTAPKARRWTERRDLASSLVGAVERGEMVAYLQPVVRTTDLQLQGFESLVRWHHPNGCILPPVDFLDVAFEAGLGTGIDVAMADQACDLLAGLGDLAGHAWVSVNMSASDLADSGLVAMINGTLTRHGLQPDRLIVEVTEQATLERSGIREQTSPHVTLRELAHLGVQIALDDFGTGYSSLTHLRMLKVHTLKIDCSFVGGIVADSTDRSLVAAIVSLARGLGLHTVAEGVELPEQLRVLRELGCDSVQGFHICEPLAPAQLRDWVEAYRSGRIGVAGANRAAQSAVAPV